MDFTDIGRRLLLRAAAEIAARHYEIEVERAEKIIAYLIQFGHVILPSLATITTNPQTALDAIRAGLNSLRSFLGGEGFTLDMGQVERVMQVPRCGCADVQQMRVESAYWRKRVLTWKFASYVNGVPKDVQEDILQKCFNDWGKYGNTKGDKHTGSGTADITIYATRIDGRGRVLAQAQIPGGNDAPLWMQIDTSELWVHGKTPSGVEVLLEAVKKHELGHNLGHFHSQRSDQLMSAFYSPNLWMPQSEDQARHLAAYGPPVNDPGNPPPGTGKKILTIELNGNVESAKIVSLT